MTSVDGSGVCVSEGPDPFPPDPFPPDPFPGAGSMMAGVNCGWAFTKTGGNGRMGVTVLTEGSTVVDAVEVVDVLPVLLEIPLPGQLRQ